MAIHKPKDNSFKLILDDHRLFVDFLLRFLPLPIFNSVSPDDIEDVSERFLPLLLENRDSDTVKRISLKNNPPLFVIAIVEHESQVNFRSPFKMLQYITLVLDKYEKEVNRDHPGLTSTKDFRYPPVLPLVFYDGPAPWTAARNFADRTALKETFAAYIPSFEYELVELNKYRFEDLSRYQDALSFLLLVDRIQKREELEELKGLPPAYWEGVALNIPEGMGKLVRDVITVLLERLEAAPEEIEAIREYVGKKEDRTMFDAFVASVLEDKRLAREEGREEGIQIGTEKKQAEAYRDKLESARMLKGYGVSEEVIARSLNLTVEEVRSAR